MENTTYEKIARLFDLIGEMNVLVLQLRQAKVTVEFGSSGPTARDPLNECSVAVVHLRLETEAAPFRGR